ncbi:hypothetical protein K0M31_017613 [Melipona bicolor]|uniref:Uncharacterized protein n=1 Tax=Melipona bicolor TaxID=60889 RepID=A0AA40G577_9HYME|nr:hypothetical protein K0M31_017613 [Melipona bicolor]
MRKEVARFTRTAVGCLATRVEATTCRDSERPGRKGKRTAREEGKKRARSAWWRRAKRNATARVENGEHCINEISPESLFLHSAGIHELRRWREVFGFLRLPGQDSAEKPRIGSNFDRCTRVNSPVVERVERSPDERLFSGYGVALPRQLHSPRMARITKQRPVPVG